MPNPDRPHNPEVPKKQYAENIYSRLPEVETGLDIPRVSAARLTTGKDTRLKLSVTERLGRDGWDPKHLAGSRKGDLVFHRTGDVFEVTEVKKGRMRIKEVGTGMEGEIIAQPINVRAHEYSYNLRDNSKHSKKIKVFDTIYKDKSLETTEFIDELVKSIPAQCMDVFDEIEIHRMGSDKAGHFRAEQSMFSDRNVLALYVSDDLIFNKTYPIKAVIETLYHELGHAIAKKIKGKVHPGKKWKQAMSADGNSVSEYADKTRYPRKSEKDEEDTGEIEDFAESVMMYLGTDGAKGDKTRALRDFCRNRFQKLDEVFEDLSKRQNASFIRKRVFKQPNSLEK